MKNVTGEDLHENQTSRESSWITKPNTIERDFVYARTVWVHLFCIHIFSNVLALTIIFAKVNGY